MSQEHVETGAEKSGRGADNAALLRRWAQAYNERDLVTLDELIADDFEFLPYMATLIETTVYQGRDGLRRYFADADAAWERIHVRVDEVREVGERAISFFELQAKGRASGLEVRIPLAIVVEARNGKLVRCEAYASQAEALLAVGLPDGGPAASA